MPPLPEITQRDLRNRSREIMDAVERGQAFTVARDGRRIGVLVPLPRRRRFVTREEFATLPRGASSVDLDAFRADQEAALDTRIPPDTQAGSWGGVSPPRAIEPLALAPPPDGRRERGQHVQSESTPEPGHVPSS